MTPKNKKPKKPKLNMTGEDGNAYFIMARAKRALEAVGRGDEWGEYTKEATAGDYANLLSVTLKWFDVS